MVTKRTISQKTCSKMGDGEQRPISHCCSLSHPFLPSFPAILFSPPAPGRQYGGPPFLLPRLGPALLAGAYGAVQRQAKGACGYMNAILSASPVQLRGAPNFGPNKARQRAPHREGSAVYKTTPPKKLYRTVKRNPLLLKSGLVYMPQAVPAHDPGRRVAPSMRHHRACPSR